jgi:hypothetical protein
MKIDNEKFEIGFDYRRFKVRLPESVTDRFILDGYKAAERCTTKKSDIYIRKWLSIRLRCLTKNRICTIVPKDIETAFLKTKGVCPILNKKLTFGEKQGLDWSVDRVDNNLGYIPTNIVIVSDFANKVKDCRDFYGIVDRYIQSCHDDEDHDLWASLLLFYAKKLPHDKEAIGQILLLGCNNSLISVILTYWIVRFRGKPKELFFIKNKQGFSFERFYKRFCKVARKLTGLENLSEQGLTIKVVKSDDLLLYLYMILPELARIHCEIFALDFYKIYFSSLRTPDNLDIDIPKPVIT